MGPPRLPSSSRDPNNLSCIPVRFGDKTLAIAEQSQGRSLYQDTSRQGSIHHATIVLERKREGHRQTHHHWNCFNAGETSARWAGVQAGFPERVDTFLNRTELTNVRASKSPSAILPPSQRAHIQQPVYITPYTT